MQPGLATELSHWLGRIERDLTENVLPFWTRRTWLETGGFTSHLDRQGERRPHDALHLLIQARMIWSLAAAHRHGLTDRGYLELARQGVAFMTETMWDREHGGFFQSVRLDGTPADTQKRVYFHSFVIYALSEYALAADDREAFEWAAKTFDLLETRARDGNRGYREQFTREWTPTSEVRTLDTHMHLMEAFTVLVQAGDRKEHRDALERVVRLILNTAIHPEHGCGLPHLAFDRAAVEAQTRTSYGHNVELAWLLLDALDVLGEPREPHRGVILGLIDHALEFGCDPVRGGVALFGPLTGHVLDSDLHPNRLIKSWWEQAEMLVALVEAYRWTRDERYAQALLRLCEWVWRFQLDHEGGDWFERVSWDGEPLVLDKGHAWKTAYHNARALMRVSSALRALGIDPFPENVP